MTQVFNIKELFYFFLMFLVAISWGGHANIMKPAMDLMNDPYLWMIFQNTPIVIILIGYHLVKPIPGFFDRAHLPYAIIIGTLAYGIANPVLAQTTHHISVSYIMLMIGLTPAMTYLISLCFRKEILSIKKIVGVIIAFTAIMYYFEQNLQLTNISMWYFIALATPLSFGIQNLTIKQWAHHNLDIRGLIFYQSLYSIILLAAWLFYQPPITAFKAIESYQSMGYLILGCLALSHYCGQYFFYLLVTRVQSLLYASQASTLSIIFGIILAALCFGDILSPSLIIATLMILVAIHLCY